MNGTRQCPALLVSAPASGQGKTTITAAIARRHRQQGRRVSVFKTGPDFIDPGFLAAASGGPVYQLDTWMGGEAECAQLLYQAAGHADVILIEGVMGLFDGPASVACLARRFGLPVLLAVDASAMAETFGAIVMGLTHYDPRLHFAGVLANRVGGPAHADMLRKSLPSGVTWLGAIPFDAQAILRERHLGLVQAEELPELEQTLDRWAMSLDSTLAALPRVADFTAGPVSAPPRLLRDIRIGIARDAAFSFLYSANLDLLQAMGAMLCFFSPLTDQSLPEVDCLYLPGGYPELHLPRLQANNCMRESVRAFALAGKPILAECGGYLYLLDQLTDQHGHSAAMCGVLKGQAHMQTRLAAIGYQSARFGPKSLRGHAFHHSVTNGIDQPAVLATRSDGSPGEPILQWARVTASYLHFYFPSNPAVVAALLKP